MIKLNFFKKAFDLNKYKNHRCVFCGSDKKILTGEKTIPDFDPKTIQKKIRTKFLNKVNGICMNCGLHQCYNPLNFKEQKIINLLGKDKMTSDINYSNEHLDSNFVKDFNNKHFNLRISQWKKYFSKIKKKKLSNVLVIRYWFGKTFEFLKENFKVNKIYGLEMSEVCKNYCKKKDLKINYFDNDINGYLDTHNLMDKKFDAIFAFHILNHSININDTLKKLKRILKRNGIIVFSNEIEKKPHNPFHNIHMSEYQLNMFLKKYFSSVDRIDNCENEFYDHVNPYTFKRDIPDLVAWK